MRKSAQKQSTRNIRPQALHVRCNMGANSRNQCSRNAGWEWSRGNHTGDEPSPNNEVVQGERSRKSPVGKESAKRLNQTPEHAHRLGCAAHALRLTDTHPHQILQTPVIKFLCRPLLHPICG